MALETKHRGLPFFLPAVLLVGGWLVAFSFTLWRMQTDALDSGEAQVAVHGRNFEDHLTRLLEVVDLVASGIDQEHLLDVSTGELDQRLERSLRPFPFVRSISLLDLQHRVVASSTPANLGVNVAIDGFFPSAAPEAEILRLGLPWQGRDFSSGQPLLSGKTIDPLGTSFIPVMRRLGKANAWLVVAVNPDYLVNYWAQLLPPDLGSVQWLRYDGVVLASSSPNASDALPGTLSPLGELVREREFGRLAGETALTAYRTSSRFPAVIVANLNREPILAVWEGKARWLASIVLPVILALVVAWVMLWRRRARLENQQRELEREQRLVASIFDASSIAILLTKPDGEIISVNPAFEKITGYTSAEAVGKKPSLLKSGMTPETVYRDLWSHIGQGRPWRGELQNRRKGGEIYWESVVISPVLDAQGQVMHHIGFLEDISATKQYEAQLREAKEAAESATLAKSRFLAMMSHEIRTPMNGILGMAQMLLHDDGTREERDDYARTILSCGQTLMNLLNDILDLSKVEAGRMVLEHNVFDPAQLLREMHTLFADAARAKRLDLESTWHDAPELRYLGDGHRIRQMIANLLSNAIKFTSAGRIEVEGREVSREGNRACLEFAVTDTGIGIPDDKVELLFVPFSQADSSMTRQFGGTGLGLSIVRSLAEMMAGTAGVESVPGVGSRFWFQVEVELASPEAAVQPEAASPVVSPVTPDKPDAKPRVLVVEDNPTNCMVVKKLLERLGVEVVTVGDGQQCIDILNEGLQPDLVLMDIQMPVLDGYAASRCIREREAALNLPRLPIVALTANAFAEDRQLCAEAGMDDFLAKPIAQASLHDVVRRWLKP